MDPVTLFAIFAAAFVVKLGEKAAHVLGERVAENGGNLLSVLQRKDPDAVTAIEQIAQKDDLNHLTEQDVVNLGIPQLVARVKQYANTDPAVKVAVDDATAVQEPHVQGAIVNLGKIGVLNQGSVFGQQNTINL